jgi:hypothetical protein
MTLPKHEPDDLALYLCAHLFCSGTVQQKFDPVMQVDPTVAERYWQRSGRELTPHIVNQRFDKAWRYAEFKSFRDRLAPAARKVLHQL